jgi:hypothetical protein
VCSSDLLADQDSLKAFICIEIIKGFNARIAKLQRSAYEKTFSTIIDEIKTKYPGLFNYMKYDSKLESFVDDFKKEMSDTWRRLDFDEAKDLGEGHNWNDTIVSAVLKAMKLMSIELPDWVKIPQTNFMTRYEEIKKFTPTFVLAFDSEVVESAEKKGEEQKGIVEDVFEKLKQKAEETTKETNKDSGKGTEDDPLKSIIDMFK